MQVRASKNAAQMSAPPITLLGQIAAPLFPHLIRFARERAIQTITEVVGDPAGYATRIGDVVVWNGSAGQKVLAGLQSLGDSQIRIEQAVTSLEGAQIATNGALGAMNAVASATLGVTTLTGALMIYRLNALNKRFDRLSQQVKDLEDTLDAQNKAYLRKAVQKLREFDDSGDAGLLLDAKNDAQTAAAIYGQLTDKEAKAQTPRLEVLNYRGRCYLVSLMTEMRARLLQNNPTEAVARFNEERSTIESFAKSTFAHAIADSPAEFLAHATREEGISLELLTEVYQHAQRLGAFSDAEIRTPADMFEYCRAKGIAGKAVGWWPFGAGPKDLSKRLKYLMACFEDIGRVEALKLIASEIKSSDTSLTRLQADLQSWQKREEGSHPPEAVFAYSFA